MKKTIKKKEEHPTRQLCRHGGWPNTGTAPESGWGVVGSTITEASPDLSSWVCGTGLSSTQRREDSFQAFFVRFCPLLLEGSGPTSGIMENSSCMEGTSRNRRRGGICSPDRSCLGVAGRHLVGTGSVGCPLPRKWVAWSRFLSPEWPGGCWDGKSFWFLWI